jgi:hypothetical protein
MENKTRKTLNERWENSFDKLRRQHDEFYKKRVPVYDGMISAFIALKKKESPELERKYKQLGEQVDYIDQEQEHSHQNYLLALKIKRNCEKTKNLTESQLRIDLNNERIGNCLESFANTGDPLSKQILKVVRRFPKGLSMSNLNRILGRLMKRNLTEEHYMSYFKGECPITELWGRSDYTHSPVQHIHLDPLSEEGFALGRKWFFRYQYAANEAAP